MADIQAQLISSVLGRKRAVDHEAESYVAHLKIWDKTEGEKLVPRYILLSRFNDGQGLIYKTKLNENGTFSIGKTWSVGEVSAVQVITGTTCAISFEKTHEWQSEDATSQVEFITALVKQHREISDGISSLRVVGVIEDL